MPMSAPREYPAAELVAARDKFRRIARQTKLLAVAMAMVAVVASLFDPRACFVAAGLGALFAVAHVLAAWGFRDATYRLLTQGGSR